MTTDTQELNNDAVQPENVIALSAFVEDFGSGLLEAVARQNPPIYDGDADIYRDAIMDGLTRSPFPAQREVVQAVSRLLIDADEPAAIINAEMGSGKSIMAVATAAVLHGEGAQHFLVLSPPHLVYKWRREIRETIEGARVWVLNGPDTLRKLLALRDALGKPESDAPEFFVLGRVRMRMGFHWRPAVARRHIHQRLGDLDAENGAKGPIHTVEAAACPDCGRVVHDEEGLPVSVNGFPDDSRRTCAGCRGPLWTLMRPGKPKNRREMVQKSLLQIPTIGPKWADRLLGIFGESALEEMLSDNVYEFINLMDENGDLVFSDRQALRIERRMATLEFGFGQGGYQPSEFIKRQLPRGTFDLLIADEAHEFKNESSAQGQAMGVLANKVRRCLLLTGTLLGGGYADDLFFLLWRIRNGN